MAERLLAQRYRLVRLLGRGASGEVFAAQDTASGRMVALKWFFPEACAHAEHEAELSALKRCASRFVLPLLGSGEAEGRSFVVTPLISGPNLENLLRANSRPDRSEITSGLVFWLNLLRGIEDIHSAALVHRDLKPSNVLAENRPGLRPASLGDFKPLIADLGFVKTRAQPGLSAGAGAGTLGYAAPELLESSTQADERSDLFSFGATLYRWLTGRLPYPTLEDLSKGISPPAAHSLNSEVPENLSAVVSDLIECDPFKRPGSAAQTAVRLQQAVYPEGVLFTPRSIRQESFEAADLTPFFRRSLIPPFPPAPDLGGFLTAQCGGRSTLLVPFVRFLLRDGTIERTAWGEYILKPEGSLKTPSRQLRRFVLKTVLPSDLLPGDRALLELLACVRSGIDLETMSALAQSPLPHLRRRLEYLERAGVVQVENESWRLTFPLLREAIEGELEPGRRREIHRALLRHRRRLLSPRDRAYHLKEVGRNAEAKKWFLESARMHMRDKKPLEAAADLEQALALPGPFPLSAVVEAGGILTATGKPGKALALYRSVPAEKTSIELLFGLGQAALRTGRFNEAWESFDQLLKRLEGSSRRSDFLRVLRGAAVAARATGRLEQAAAMAEKILQLERADPGTRSEGFHLLGLVAKERGDFLTAQRFFREAVEESRKLGEGRRLAVALTNLGNVLRAQGDLDGAIAAFSEALRLRRETNDQQGIAITANSLAQTHFQRGDIIGALEAVSESYRKFVSAGDRKGCAVALGNRGIFLWHAGKTSEALAALRRARGIAEQIGDKRRNVELSLWLGQLLLLQGDDRGRGLLRAVLAEGEAPADVKAVAEAALALAELKSGRQTARLPEPEKLRAQLSVLQDAEARAQTAAQWSECFLLAGRCEPALTFARDAYEGLPQGASPFLRCTLARVLGEAWRERGPLWADYTERYLEEALNSAASLPFAYEEARAGFAWACYMSYLGEISEADRLAREAEQKLRRLGAGPDAARVRAFLQEVHRGADA